MTEKVLNIKDFVELARNTIIAGYDLSVFDEVINHYDMSLGGCGCSRSTRERYADDKFSQKINNVDLNTLLAIKKYLDLKEEDSLIFIKKDNTLIRKI